MGLIQKDRNALFPELAIYQNHFSTPEVYKDTDSKNWIEFMFLLYMSRSPLQNEGVCIPFCSLLPYNWKNINDMLIHLKWSIDHNVGNILFDTMQVIALDPDENNKYIAYEAFDFFEDYSFLKEETDWSRYGIGCIGKPPVEYLQKLADEIVETNYWLYKKYGSYRKTFLQIEGLFESYYRLYGKECIISKKDFKKYPEIEFMKTILFMYSSQFFQIIDMGSDSEMIDGKIVLYPRYTVILSDTYIKIVEAKIQQKEILLQSLYNENILGFSVQKKGGSAYMLENKRMVHGDAIRFVELQKQYPHSEIIAKNYSGKTMKYEVKEKIKLDQPGPRL